MLKGGIAVVYIYVGLPAGSGDFFHWRPTDNDAELAPGSRDWVEFSGPRLGASAETLAGVSGTTGYQRGPMTRWACSQSAW